MEWRLISKKVKHPFTRTRYRNLGRFRIGTDSLKEHYLLDKQITVKRFQKSAIFGKDFSKNSVSQNEKKMPYFAFTDSSTVSSKG